MKFTDQVKDITFKREFEGKHGVIYVFNIIFEDGTKGEFNTTKRNQDKFVIGERVDYTAVEQINKRDNSKYFKIDKFKEPYTGNTGSGGRTSKNNPDKNKKIVASVALDFACVLIDNLNLGEHVSPNLAEIHSLANKFYDFILAKSGNDVDKSITYQSRLKQVINHFTAYSKLEIKNSDDVLKYIEIEVEYIYSKV